MKLISRMICFLSILVVFQILGCAPALRIHGTDTIEQSVNSTNDLYYLVLKAHYLSFSGRVEEGKAIFIRCLEIYPQDVNVRYQYAKFLLDLSFRITDQELALELIGSARDSLIEAVKIDSRNLEVKKLLSDILIELGSLPEAIHYLEEIQIQTPLDQKVKSDLARLYVHMRSPEKAVALLKPLIDANDVTNYDVYKSYGLACGDSNQLPEAIEIYNRYLGLFPDEYEALFNLALCYYRSGQFYHSAEILEKLKASGRMTVDGAEIYTNVLKEQGRYEEAIELLTEISKNSRFEIAAKIEIGQIYLSQGDSKSASDYFTQAVSKAPNDRRATFYSAVALSELGRYEDALRMLENNLEDKPVSVASVDLATEILLKLNNVDLALNLCQRLLDERAKDARSYVIASHVFDFSGSADACIAILKKGVDIFPDHVSLNMMLAYKLEQVGNWREAIRIAERLLVIAPDDPDVANFIGYTLADRNDELERALELIEIAVKSDPENPAFIDSLAWIYYRMGRYAEALTQILKAVDKLPDDPIIISHLINICIAEKSFDRARTVLEDALNRFPDNKELLKCRQLLETINGQ